MTNRERLFAVLDQKPTDRIPMWLLFPYHATGYYADVRNNPCYRDIHDHSTDRCIILDRRGLPTSTFAPSVEIGDVETTDGEWRVSRREYRYGDLLLFSETRSREVAGGRTETRRKKLIASEEELETLAEFPFNTDRDRIVGELDEALPRYEREREEFPEHFGSMMLDLGEPIGFLYHASDLGEYPIWSLTRNDEVAHILNSLMEQAKVRYRYCLERRLADVYFMVGSELASPPMVSRDTFRRWVVPYAKELIAMIHQDGGKVIQHYHGQIGEILEDFVEMAPDGLHTIEAPPIGNCTLDQAFRTTQSKITLIGNIQYDEFRAMSPQQMRDAVRDVIAEADGRPFILSPSAGPYEETISETVRRNFFAFIDAGWEFGGNG